MCRAGNRHGNTAALFRVEIRYAQLSALNRTTSDAESENLRQPRAVYINSVENSSLTLNCRLESNERQEIVWRYYQLDRRDRVVNAVRLSDFAVVTEAGRNGVERTFSRLMINGLGERHSGYYACAVHFRLADDLNNSAVVAQNVTYYLQVQCEWICVRFFVVVGTRGILI